ncbi:hypothetical protein O3P69_020213 [Scylla paramamosain]|uniref:THAP-type domain-containing protein n=1 Tax=Scylla paramamosain TaxID=85552 RepID=A0AAW0TND5_SCYPA
MPRGSTCKAKGCTSNKNDNPELSFHSFPRNKERFKLWCELIKRPDLNHGKAISSRMSMRVCSLHFEDHMYMSPTNKSRLIWCAVPKPVEIKVSEREEKAPVASLLPELDANEKSYSYSSCPEDIIIKEESVMDEDSCDDVSPPSYCPESSSAEFLADSKVGILEHSQSGQCVREGADSKSHLDNPESGQALCSAKTEILGPVTDASVSFDSLVLPPDDNFEIISIQEKNVCSLKEDVIDGPRKPVKEMDSNQDSIMCISSEPLNSGSQMDKTNNPSSRLSLPIDSSTTSETKITISNVKKFSISHNLANASSQSQPKSTSSQSSISPSKSFSVSQLNAPNNCSIVLQEFPSRHQSKLFNSDSTEPFADTISMKENFCEKLEVNEETINERKSKCGEDCGCDKCFAAAEVMKATSRRTYSGPIRRQIVRTKSGAKRTIMIVKKASLKNLRAKGLIQPIGKKYTANQTHSLQSSKKNIIQYVSLSTNDPSNNPLKCSQSEDSLPLKEADLCRKSSSIQTQLNADDNCDGYSSSTDSVDEPEVSSHATQTPNPQAVNQNSQVPVKVSLAQTSIPQSINQDTQAPVTVPLAQTPNPQFVNQHTQAAVTMPLAQTPIPQSVSQDTQAPVTVSWAPVNGSNSLSFTFTVTLPPGFSTPSGISHDSLQKATSLLNNTAQCTVSQPNLQTEDPNQRSSSHSLSNSGITPDQRIKGSKELVSPHSITTRDSWQIDTPTALSKHLLPSPIMNNYNPSKVIDKNSDSHSCETMSPIINTSPAMLTQEHLGHRPIHVTIPDLACEATSEENKIHSTRNPKERREGDQPSKTRPKNRESIQWIAVPSASVHQSPPPSPGAPEPIGEPDLTSDCQMLNTTPHSSKQSSAALGTYSISSLDQRVPRMHCPTLYRGANKELKRKYTYLLNKHRQRYYALLKKYKILEEKYTPLKDVGTPEQIIRDARKFLSEEHLLFLESQMFLRNRPGTGNRFSRKFMNLMLKYYKRSGAGYRYLRTIFTIPSMKTIQKYVAKSIDSWNEDALAGSREDCEAGSDEVYSSHKKKAEDICQDSSSNETPSKANASAQSVEYEDNSANHCDSEESSLEGMEVEESEHKS